MFKYNVFRINKFSRHSTTKYFNSSKENEKSIIGHNFELERVFRMTKNLLAKESITSIKFNSIKALFQGLFLKL